MGRRKRDVIEDDSSDSGGGDSDDGGYMRNNNMDQDERAEHDLFSDPYKRKRRRGGGKEDAIYGSFGDDDEAEGRGASSSKAKVDWTKAPAFVSGDVTKVDIDKELEEAEEESGEEDGDEDGDEEDDSSSSSIPKPSSSRVPDMDEEEDEPKRMGLGGMGAAKSTAASFGFGASKTTDQPPVSEPPGPQRGGIGSSARAGIGGRSGIGQSHSQGSELPTSFGAVPSRAQRSFIRETSTPQTAPKLSSDEARHFNSLKGSFGAKMLEKMGWQTGTGLGANNEGIVRPVESKLRPQKMGLGHGGFKEKTDQSRAEARRRGEAVTDDEEESTKARNKKGKGKAKDGTQDQKDQWKRPKKVKTVVQHRTYEEIMAEAGGESSPAGLGVIIDATGATPREISSLSQASASPWGATNDPERLPELRHNLRLIVDMAKGELDGLAREAKALEERKKWTENEDSRLRKAVADEAEMISRLQNIHLIVDDVNLKAKQAGGLNEPSLDIFNPSFSRLIAEYQNEYNAFKLDDIVVAAIAPIIRRLLSSWDPLQTPDFLTEQLKMWCGALRMSKVEEPTNQVGFRGTQNGFTKPIAKVEATMTPYESLLWNVWLPKVRSCVNNDWSPSDPQPMIALFVSWSNVIPQFIHDNILDQLILPKVQKAVSDWTPRKDSTSLHSLVFPWLPHIGLRMDQFIGDARRKVKNLFRSWKVNEGVPTHLMVWKEVFDPSEWSGLLLKYVVPKLAATLRDDFRINPRKQDMEPLNWVMQWVDHLKESVFAQLLETEFFPKWLDILHLWLVQPNVNYDQVTEWYTFWKETLDKVYALPGVTHGFKSGLELMNEALSLGPKSASLPKPQYKPLSSAPGIPKLGNSTKADGGLSSAMPEVTFRSIVEDYASAHNMLFVPTGRIHEKSRMPLFKVSQNVDGRGGILVYIQDDAVWAASGDGEDYRAIGLEDMILRATRPKK